MTDLVTVDRLREQQEAYVDAIISARGGNLPDRVEDIVPILAFSTARMKAYQALCDATRKVADQERLNEEALASGQRWGIVHLYGQKRLGELTREMPGTQGVASFNSRTKQLQRAGLGESEGTARRSASDAERIAAHPEVLERVIAESSERKEIPTKTAVLREIRREQDKATREVMNQTAERSRATAGIEVQTYMNTLMRVLNLLPADPPSDGWNEETMEEAKRMAHVIASRLRRFA